jgi:hypothetical protein
MRKNLKNDVCNAKNDYKNFFECEIKTSYVFSYVKKDLLRFFLRKKTLKKRKRRKKKRKRSKKNVRGFFLRKKTSVSFSFWNIGIKNRVIKMILDIAGMRWYEMIYKIHGER